MINKIHYKKIEELFGFTRQTWAKWQKEERPIIKLLDYFDDNDIAELLIDGRIQKFENIQMLQDKSNSILDKFFFEHYSRKPINRDFSKYIFPKFEDYINNYILEIKEKFPDKENNFTKIKYMDKHNFYEFILNIEETEDFSKVSAINTISKLEEIEFFIIVTQYHSFLTNHSSKTVP